MGALSFSTLLSTGLNIAGRTDLTALATVWLNGWLRSQYKSWPWPFLYRRTTAIPLNAGTTSLTLGAGNGTITNEIQQIRDPLWVYTSDYGKRSKARIKRLIDGDIFLDETVNSPASGTGMPQAVKVRANANTWGAWDVFFHPVPDTNYLVAVDYLVQPADVSDISLTPIYPNDHTMWQAVVVAAQQYLNNYTQYAKELDVLSALSVSDRVKYGMVEGTNSELPLDGAIFRGNNAEDYWR